VQTPAISDREKRRSASEEMLDLDRRLSLHSSIKQSTSLALPRVVAAGKLTYQRLHTMQHFYGFGT
jgi:hypothetical protein